MNGPAERVVRNFEQLYSVAIVLALGRAIENIVRDSNAPGSILAPGSLPAFVALFVTLVPFYHGAMRHLDRTYVQERAENVRTGTLLVDFLLLFVEGALFFVIAELLPDASAAAWGIVVLLLLDAVWGTAVFAVFYRRRQWRAEMRWVALNLLFAPTLALFLVLAPDRPSAVLDLPVATALVLIALARSALDYATSWDFYFPSMTTSAVKEPTG
jgi:hypothetical protein